MSRFRQFGLPSLCLWSFQPFLRQVWGNVIGEAKKAIDVKSLMELGTKQLWALDNVFEFLKDNSTDTAIAENWPSQWFDNDFMDLSSLRADLLKMDVEEGRGIGEQLTKTFAELKDFLAPRFKENVTTLKSWLANLWVFNDGGLDVADMETAMKMFQSVVLMSAMSGNKVQRLGFRWYYCRCS